MISGNVRRLAKVRPMNDNRKQWIACGYSTVRSLSRRPKAILGVLGRRAIKGQTHLMDAMKPRPSDRVWEEG